MRKLGLENSDRLTLLATKRGVLKKGDIESKSGCAGSPFGVDKNSKALKADEEFSSAVCDKSKRCHTGLHVVLTIRASFPAASR